MAPMRAILALSALAVMVGGCGRAVITRSGAEQAVAQLVERKTGFPPAGVTCPSGVQAKVGKSFDCRFTGPGRRPYVAHVRIVAVHGSQANFFIATQPAGS
jgi:Domain of unknown function (DUF4333)